MGFSTIMSQVIFFSFMLVVLVGVFMITKSTLEEDKETLDINREKVARQINTKIDIENASYSGGVTTVLVRNQGSTTLKTEYIDVYIDQNRVLRNSSDLTISVSEPDIINPRMWDPDELLKIEYDQTLAVDNHTVTVVTENSAMDTKIFERN